MKLLRNHEQETGGQTWDDLKYVRSYGLRKQKRTFPRLQTFRNNDHSRSGTVQSWSSASISKSSPAAAIRRTIIMIIIIIRPAKHMFAFQRKSWHELSQELKVTKQSKLSLCSLGVSVEGAAYALMRFGSQNQGHAIPPLCSVKSAAVHLQKQWLLP